MEQFLSDTMKRYGDTVYRLALCRLQNISDAEDVYQEVFLRLLNQKAEGWDEDHLKFWLIRTTLNRCADLGRFRLRTPVLPLSEAMQTVSPMKEETAELWDAVARLPVKLRTPVHLYYAEGYSAEEIGRMLKLSPNTVRTRLHRARQKLKITLGEFDDEK